MCAIQIEQVVMKHISIYAYCVLAALRHIVSKVLLEESEGVTSFLDDFFIKNSSLWIGECY